MQQFKISYEYIHTNAQFKIIELEKFKMSLDDICADIYKSVFDIAKEDAVENIGNFLDSLNEYFCTYVDAMLDIVNQKRYNNIKGA